MPLTFNIRHLDTKDLHLKGELSPKELDIEFRDELVHPGALLKYDLNVQKLDDEILVQGDLHLPITCECVRCLKEFEQTLDLVDWAALLPLEGEEKIAIHNDLVDLTPYLREDILLAFPQHPLCDAECAGLPKDYTGEKKKAEAAEEVEGSAIWSELNKLKL
jgi:uncharacterized protein